MMLLFGLLGGSFFGGTPPGALEYISKITPNAWGQKGFTILALGGSLQDLWPTLAGLLVMAIVLLTIYGQVAHHGYAPIDDDGYVSENDVVRAGLSASGLRWAFAGFHMNNWHPVTWQVPLSTCSIRNHLHRKARFSRRPT